MRDKAFQSYWPNTGPPVVNARCLQLTTGTTHTKRHVEVGMSHQDGKAANRLFLHTEL